MTDRKQSAVARRLISNYNNSTVSDLQGKVEDLTYFIAELQQEIFPPLVSPAISSCPGLSIDLGLIYDYLENGPPGLIDPSENFGYGTPDPTISPGELGYFTTYVISLNGCDSQFFDGNWSIGDVIEFEKEGESCVLKGIFGSLEGNVENGYQLTVRIYYPLPSSCITFVPSENPINYTLTGWTIKLPKEKRDGCCVIDLDGGWCPVKLNEWTTPDLSVLWENVIDGGSSEKKLGIPIISGGYS
jgi:hypothetical protein